MAHAGVALMIVIPAYGIALKRSGVSLRAIAGQLARPVAGGVLAAAAGVAIVLWVGDDLVALVVGCALVGLVYGAVVYPMRALLKASAVTA